MNCSIPHIYSTLASDPDLSDLVTMYVDEMPERIEQIQDAHRSNERETLIRLIHQLKGAAGSYGFATLTDAAAVVEQKLLDAADDAESAINELLQMCSNVRAGTND